MQSVPILSTRSPLYPGVMSRLPSPSCHRLRHVTNSNSVEDVTDEDLISRRRRFDEVLAAAETRPERERPLRGCSGEDMVGRDPPDSEPLRANSDSPANANRNGDGMNGGEKLPKKEVGGVKLGSMR
ncbi:hypothetical protein EYF80_046178 [Liparis tanakae]|uniref:Uncharacterized protein n=1 Tax=Liparis tanakae TaxID=230148 RepID=A0A4Z2FSF4_9TELE|nr:hypothetical protein EYF80_046178 [Liparis tanakae]